MKQTIREYNKKRRGAWRLLDIGGGFAELENIETGDRMSYELTGWAAQDSAYIDGLCGYTEA
jgi:hypothetical protein